MPFIYNFCLDQDGITGIRCALPPETTNKRTTYMNQRFARHCRHQRWRPVAPEEQTGWVRLPSLHLECLGLRARREIELSHLTGSGKRAESRHLELPGQRTGKVRLTEWERPRSAKGTLKYLAEHRYQHIHISKLYGACPKTPFIAKHCRQMIFLLSSMAREKVKQETVKMPRKHWFSVLDSFAWVKQQQTSWNMED